MLSALWVQKWICRLGIARDPTATVRSVHGQFCFTAQPPSNVTRTQEHMTPQRAGGLHTAAHSSCCWSRAVHSPRHDRIHWLLPNRLHSEGPVKMHAACQLAAATTPRSKCPVPHSTEESMLSWFACFASKKRVVGRRTNRQSRWSMVCNSPWFTCFASKRWFHRREMSMGLWFRTNHRPLWKKVKI